MRKSKRSILFFILILIVLFPALVIIIVWSSNYRNKSYDNAYKCLLTEVHNSADDLQDFFRNQIDNIKIDPDIIELKKDLEEDNYNTSNIDEQIVNLATKNDMIASISLINNKEQIVSEHVVSKEKYEDIVIIENNNNAIKDSTFYSSTDNIYTLIILLYDDDNYLGYLSIGYKNSKINNITSIKSDYKTERMYIIDMNSEIKNNYGHKITNIINEILKNKSNNIVTFKYKSHEGTKLAACYKSPESGITIMGTVNELEAIRFVKSELLIGYIITIIIFVVGIMIHLRYRSMIDKSVKKLIDEIQRVNKGERPRLNEVCDDYNVNMIFKELDNLMDNMDYLKMADIDTLTGIYTRESFLEKAEQILMKNKDLYSIIRFDVDNFEYLNNVYGYKYSNTILKRIAQVLKQNKFKKVLYGRANGDNYYILLEEKDDELLIYDINCIINEFLDVRDRYGKKVLINFAFGIYKIENDAATFESIIENVGIAHENAKKKYGYKSSYVFYEEIMRKNIIEEKTIENLMNEALKNGEFEVYLQGKNDLKTLEVIGAEALVRWNSKEMGHVMPNVFIPIFENNGFILELDFYVLEEVCKKIRKWINDGIEPKPISVNQSKKHLDDEGYIDKLKSVIEKYDIPTEYVELEITESAVLDDNYMLINIINELHSKGFKISIDDFGSGYSSLNFLKEINADVLKIDREFLREVCDEDRSKTIIKHIIELAKELQIKTITEGVETKEQSEFLRNIGCDMVQGFLYCKPVPIEEFERKYYYKKG